MLSDNGIGGMVETSTEDVSVGAKGGALTPLQVLVQHLPRLPEPTHQRVLCKLLATAASVRALVKQHCSGKLSLSFSTYSQDRLSHSFVPWLSKHAVLLSSLTLDLSLSNNSCHDAETAIGAALQKASAAAPTHCGGCWQPQPGLCLTAYSSHPALTGPVLDQLDR